MTTSSEPRIEPSTDDSFPRRGEVWFAELDPVVGAEIGKTRRVVIVSNDQNNRFSETVTVLPLTSQLAKRRYLHEVNVPQGTANLPADSRVKANQIRTIAKKRIRRFVGVVPIDYMKQTELAMRRHLNIG